MAGAQRNSWFALLLAAVFLLCGCATTQTGLAPATAPVKTAEVVMTATLFATTQPAPAHTREVMEATATPQPSPPAPTPARTQMTLDDGMVMLYVPAGDFLMGSLDGDGEQDERPQHSVYIDAFWIDETEVTNRMYKACVDAGACKAPARAVSYTREDYYSNPQFMEYPVIYVDWFRASRYCQWAGKRLPSEAEWEKAARGVDGLTYPWGNGEPGAQQANYGWLVGDTAKVGGYPAGASPYGALDMAGNVMEWVSDWYEVYTTSPYKTYNPTGPESGSHRIARGGSYLFGSFLIRGAERYWLSPYYVDDDLGFRCAFSENK